MQTRQYQSMPLIAKKREDTKFFELSLNIPIQKQMNLQPNLNYHIMIVYSRLKLYYVCRVGRKEKDRKISEFPRNAHHRLLASSPSPSKNRFTREKSNWRADSQAAGGRRRFVKAIKGSRREKKERKNQKHKVKEHVTSVERASPFESIHQAPPVAHVPATHTTQTKNPPLFRGDETVLRAEEDRAKVKAPYTPSQS